MWDRLWTFRTRHFTVELACMPEQGPDLSWDEDGEVAGKIDSGEFVNVTFRVRILGPNGEELGADYLGNSIYADPSDFRREHIGAQGRWGSYFRDMLHEAITEARAELLILSKVRVREDA